MTNSLLWTRLLVIFAVLVCLVQAAQDYYQILGVNRNVDDKGLKKACKSLLFSTRVVE